MKRRTLSVAGALFAGALILGVSLPAQASDSKSGTAVCAPTQQYGVTTTLSVDGNPTSTTPATHYYTNGVNKVVYGIGAKSSVNVGVSSGGWNAVVGGAYTFYKATHYCVAKAG